jgi:hypothetical protein
MISLKLGAIKCESGNVEMQWNNIKTCVLDTMSKLVGKIERKGRKNYRRLRNKLKRVTDKAS